MNEFSFGSWVAHPKQNLLVSPEVSSRLEPKVMALLHLLASRAPEVVATSEILEEIWRDVYVVDGVVYRAIALLRKALGDDSKAPRYIESVPRVGYRFLQPVSLSGHSEEAADLGSIDVVLQHPQGVDWLIGLAQGVAQYLRWGSDALQVFVSETEKDCRFRLSVTAESDGYAAWQLFYGPTNELIWSNTVAKQNDSAHSAQVSESIAQSALEHIYRNQTRRLAMLVVPDSQRSYWDLILLSDRFRSTDAADLSSRRDRLLRAIEMFPQLAPAYAAWADYGSWLIINGLAENMKEQAKTARLAADMAVDLEPNSPEGLSRCGAVYARLGEYDQGIQLCRRAAELAPSVSARESLARVLCFAGQPSESVAIYRTILESLPAGQAFQYGKLVVPLVQQGEFESAEEYSQLGVVNYPKDFYGWALRCNLLAQLGREDEALAAWHQVAELRPELKITDLALGTQRTYGRTPTQRHNLTRGYLQIAEML